MGDDRGAPASPGRRLREAWAAGAIQVPGVFNALVARMAERLGFPAVYLSGAALSAAAAVPDVGLLTATDFVEQARGITLATALPLLARAHTRLDAALDAERTHDLVDSSRVARIHLEELQLPQ